MTTLLPLRSVKAKTSLSRTSIYRLMAYGKFPDSVPLGGRVSWVESEIEAWVLDRIAARPGAAV